MKKSEMTPLEAAEILEHPEKHLQGKISVQPSLLRGAPDCVGGKIGFSQEYWGAVNQAASYLRAIAAREYKRVVHAHWNENWKHTDGRINRECSACHGRTSEYTPTPICPWCGALMDGKGDSR